MTTPAPAAVTPERIMQFAWGYVPPPVWKQRSATAQFQAPVGNFAASNFGQGTGANAARIGQGALRIVF